MAFIDSNISAYGGLNPGAPSGGGVGTTANAPAVGNSAPGANGLGSGMSVQGWTLLYLAIIIGILVTTGVLFNNKGRK